MGFAGFLLYLATNLDNAFILIGCLAGREGARLRITFALTVTATIVLVFGLGLTELIDDLPPLPLNMLGLVPLGLGVLGLVRTVHTQPAKSDVALWTVTVLAMSNSSDTLVTLVSFLAERPDAVRLPVTAGYIAGVALLCICVVRLLQVLANAPRVAFWAARIGPLIMIGFGLFILLDSGGDKL